MTQDSVRNYGGQGYRWLIRGPVQISRFGLDVWERGVGEDWRHSAAGRGERGHSSRDDESRVDARTDDFGYTGECSGECGNFTLTRNGTCLKSAPAERRRSS